MEVWKSDLPNLAILSAIQNGISSNCELINNSDQEWLTEMLQY